MAKALADDHRTVLVDLPHHGRSPWSEQLRLRRGGRRAGRPARDLFGDDDPVTLVGHSMGGKAAMVTALRAPELVRRLCVVDIAPVDYGGRGEFEGYVEAMQGLDLAALGRRSDGGWYLGDGGWYVGYVGPVRPGFAGSWRRDRHARPHCRRCPAFR